MKTLIIIATLLLSGCSHKAILKNCVPTADQNYFVCDTLNALGK